MLMAQHKWHKEIKAWAYDDQCIEVCKAGIWYSTDYPNWNFADEQYRIKPQPDEPQYLYVYQKKGTGLEIGYAPHEATNMWETKIIGKIKLEVDDGN